jgi:outer membrane protein insertion porin family
VTIKPQPAGDEANGNRISDVLVTVEEQPPRLMTYGGGFSTDLGLSGFFDIRHVNLLGRLWQGGARIKLSQRQQLVQFDLINPRFLRDGRKRFTPLTLTAQYQRDTTVTRFFRSAFDRGTFGIVQRVDEEGNPIDEFGRDVGSPTINRAALFAETSRTISRKDRSILFVRYRFEDVRLKNIESLLIKDLLRPDARNRISGFGVTFVRDTRKNCSVTYSLLDLIDKGEQTDPCRYNASDPTGGHFLTADYNVSIPAMGANVGFQKFQISYNYYYTFGRTTIATRAILGAGRVSKGGDRYAGSQFPFLQGLLPISERFFGGGPNTLRGFDFEEAGPRVVIVPTGKFRNSDGEEVFLDPFTIPFGGNAIAVVNVEGRIPLSRSIRAVPFYDGGNVFRRASHIFKKPEVAPGDIAGFNQRAVWTHSFGLGLRLKTPVGGEFGVDFGYLLNPPSFLIPQPGGAPPAMYRLKREQLHFRFSQAF